MTRWTWERWAALSGLVAVALWVIGVVIDESSSLPGDDPNEILSWFQDESNTILVGAFIFMLGSLFFLIFLGALRARLVEAEGRRALLTAIAFGAGIVTTAMTLLIPGPNLAGALAEDDLTPEAAQALTVMDDAFFVGAELAAALLLAATGFAILRYGALPRWLAWISFLFALWLLIPPIGWAGLLVGVPLWTIIVTLLLWMRPGGEPVAARPPEPIP
ncbi:MAG TPA: hypothetical protein VJL85_02575 [Gaiellaceae bacterium]|nr:hypothetical protein [Gaiellaceae bacterium]